VSFASDSPAEDVVLVTPHKEPSQLLDAVDSPIIGLSSDLVTDSLPQFPHRLPAALQNPTAGGTAGAIHQANADGEYTGDLAPSASRGPHRDGVSDRPGTGGGSSGAAGGQPVGSSGNKAPAYPREAKRRREEGTVWLSIEVLEDGSVGQISVSQSSGHELLDEAALDAVKRWQFTPARVEGRFVRSEGRLPIEFVLRG
jgi:protein TonB